MFLAIISDMICMQGITVPEIAKMLGITEDAVRKRIEVAGIQPKSKDWVYDESILETLRSSPGRGRPPKKIENLTK
jgi:predicted ArsR family transcriptional regulator